METSSQRGTGAMVACDICQRSFPSRNLLFRHLQNQHGYERDPVSATGRTESALLTRSQYSNRSHNAYYGLQCEKGVISPPDWETAQTFFRKPLNVSFRLSHCHEKVAETTPLRKQIVEELTATLSTHLEVCPYLGPEMCRVARIPPREWPDLMQKKLSDAQDLGALNRQELSSMVPALLLDINPGMSTLDLCAAPGSKTLHILDIVNLLAATDGHTLSSDSALVVANDPNRKRLLDLARRSRLVKRHHLVLNSSDGRYFPSLRHCGGYKLKFDRVLADVPCSGDGTLRKLSSKGWNDWHVRDHLSLHKLQLKLLVRAMELVKKGGKIVYSTCSLDPIENEAVVASAIARMGGPTAYRILPIPDRLTPSSERPFCYSSGATTWLVPHPAFSQENQVTFEDIRDVPPETRKSKITVSMFPPCTRKESNSVESTLSQKERERMRKFGDYLLDEEVQELEAMLPHCCRILPQHLNSGGFFCAIIERVPARFYAVSCHRMKCNSDNHGRIYHGVASIAKARKCLGLSKADRIDYHFEGLSTLVIAQMWLKNHDAFVAGRSDSSIDLSSASVNTTTTFSHTDTTSMGNNSRTGTPIAKEEVEKSALENDRPQFTRLFRPPHDSLLAEFAAFFGLSSDPKKCSIAGVEVFPLSDVVVVGGGPDALNVLTVITELLARNEATQRPICDKNANRNKLRFLKLTLVARGLKSLFRGGARFDPMEVGTTLCWVPVVSENPNPSPAEQPLQAPATMTTTASSTIYHHHTAITSSRAFRSGRYGLVDEAVEWVGRCATRRVLCLNDSCGRRLLTTKQLSLRECEFFSMPDDRNRAGTEPPHGISVKWWQRWGKYRLHHDRKRDSMTKGGIIVVCPCKSKAPAGEKQLKSAEQIVSTMFLSCVLVQEGTGVTSEVHREGAGAVQGYSSDGGQWSLQLLTEQHLADAYLRLL